MPSDRRQLNVRLSDEEWDRLEALVPRIRAALGLSRFGTSDAVRLGLDRLEREFPAEEKPAPSPRRRRAP